MYLYILPVFILFSFLSNSFITLIYLFLEALYNSICFLYISVIFILVPFLNSNLITNIRKDRRVESCIKIVKELIELARKELE
jgi:hypothetical protein